MSFVVLKIFLYKDSLKTQQLSVFFKALKINFLKVYVDVAVFFI